MPPARSPAPPCIACWVDGKECEIGTIPGSCKYCVEHVQAPPDEGVGGPNFYIGDLIDEEEFAAYFRDTDPNNWHTAVTITPTVTQRGTADSGDQPDLRLKIPLMASTRFPQGWDEDVDGQVAMIDAHVQFTNPPADPLWFASLARGYLSILCPKSVHLQPSSSLSEDRQREFLFVLVFVILQRLSVLLTEGLGGILRDLATTGNIPQSNSPAMRGLATLYHSLSSPLEALENNRVTTLLDREDFKARFVTLLRDWKRVALHSPLNAACAARLQWHHGLDKEHANRLKFPKFPDLEGWKLRIDFEPCLFECCKASSPTSTVLSEGSQTEAPQPSVRLFSVGPASAGSVTTADTEAAPDALTTGGVTEVPQRTVDLQQMGSGLGPGVPPPDPTVVHSGAFYQPPHILIGASGVPSNPVQPSLLQRYPLISPGGPQATGGFAPWSHVLSPLPFTNIGHNAELSSLGPEAGLATHPSLARTLNEPLNHHGGLMPHHAQWYGVNPSQATSAAHQQHDTFSPPEMELLGSATEANRPTSDLSRSSIFPISTSMPQSGYLVHPRPNRHLNRQQSHKHHARVIPR